MELSTITLTLTHFQERLSMIIKLLSKQIPTFWESIKFATVQADEIDARDLQPYLNELLHTLLSDKAQCFIALNNERILKGLLVTRVMVDRVTSRKHLLLQSLYVWEKLNDADWREAYNVVKEFAEKEQCKSLSFSSRNPATWLRMDIFGFKEKTRTLEVRLA
jgi:hypothetical protein